MLSPSTFDYVLEDDDEPTLVCEEGTVLANKYVLVRRAGFGGMSQLWVAKNKATDAEVCVKVLVRSSGAKDGDAEAVERFRREAHAAANLSHRAIVSVFDFLELDLHGETIKNGETPRAYAIIMELLSGETLGDMLAKRGKVPVEEALDLFLPVVSALAHAHRASVIHRDIKPDNIFLAKDPDGQVIPKVLDFGVSKLPFAEAITIDGVVVGTPSFMSPEQAKGARFVDARSDVFSAAILLYMMLSGANPFERDRAAESSEQPRGGAFASAVEAVLRREVPPLDGVSPAIWAVLERALKKDPNDRWNDATEMGIALRKAAGRRVTTESNPIIPLEPISQRTLAPMGASSDRASLSDAEGSSVPGAPSSKHPRRHADSNVSVPPVQSQGTDSPTGNTGAISADTEARENARRRRRNIAFGILGVSAALLVASLMVKIVGGVTPTASSTEKKPSAAAVSIPSPAITPTAPQQEPRPSDPAAAASDAPPAESASAQASAKPKSPVAPITKPKKTPTRKPGEPNIARDPGF